MDRKSLREFTHKADNFLSITNSTYKQWVFRFTFLELEKDLYPRGDITSEAVFTENKRVEAQIVAKADGVLCGADEVKYFLEEGDPNFRPSVKDRFSLKFNFKDGEKVKKGDVICEISGGVFDILAVERTVLNLLMRMSGIATYTASIVEKVKKNDVLVVPTRKTLWGLLDKRAVLVAGGGTHRINLADAIMVKDTHLDLIGRNYEKLFENLAKKGVDGRFVEVEVESVAEALEVGKIFAEYIREKRIRNMGVLLFDNMSPKDIESALAKIKKAGVYSELLFEASGGIDENNISEYAASGVDIISMGALTLGSNSLDMSLKVVS